MTDHVARLYAAALALVAFFLTWAVIAARPWAAEAAADDPRVVALERREERLRRESARVERKVERRFAAYRTRLAERQRVIAAVPDATAPSAPAPPAPSVGAVSIPPVTSTRSS
jgi:hypothetical protein